MTIVLPNEMIYYIGIAFIGFSILITAVAVPAFILLGNRLKKQLEHEYGKQ